MPAADLRAVLASWRRRYLRPAGLGGKHHLRKTIVGRAARLHPDVDATTGGRHLVRVENNSFREYEINRRKRRTAHRQIVKEIFVHEICEVPDDRLRMYVVGRRILRRSPGKIEGDAIAFLDKRQKTRPHQRGSPADRIV